MSNKISVNGLTTKDFKILKDLLIKANSEQLTAINKTLLNEQLKRNPFK